MSRRISCGKLVPNLGMRMRPHAFECPYCGRSVPRGGKAEGFRKAGFGNHVYTCREILLYERGYLIGDYVHSMRDHTAVPIAQAADWSPRIVRGIKAQIRRRKRDGQVPTWP